MRYLRVSFPPCGPAAPRRILQRSHSRNRTLLGAAFQGPQLSRELTVGVRATADLPLSPDWSNLHGMNYRDRITVEPGKRGGKPCIRGLRITVYDILDYLAGWMSDDQILADFPDLEREDIRASLAFAADRERRLAGDPAA